MLPFALNQVAVARGMMEKDKLVTDFLYYNNVSLFDCTINWYTIVVSLSVLNHTYHGNHGCGQITQDWNLTDPFNTTFLAYRVPIVVVRLKLGVQLLFELSYYELDYIPITYLCEEKKTTAQGRNNGKNTTYSRLLTCSRIFRRWLAATANLAVAPDSLGAFCSQSANSLF